MSKILEKINTIKFDKHAYPNKAFLLGNKNFGPQFIGYLFIISHTLMLSSQGATFTTYLVETTI